MFRRIPVNQSSAGDIACNEEVRVVESRNRREGIIHHKPRAAVIGATVSTATIREPTVT